MPTMSLTQLAVERIKAPASGRVDYWDKNLPGFGLRVTEKGNKSWTVMYRLRGQSKLERLTIGSLADFPKVEQARDRARDIRQIVARGENPKATKAEPEIRTVKVVVETFLDRYMRAKGRAESYIAETKRIFDQDVIPKWGERDIRAITRADVVDLIDGVVDDGRPVQANRTLAAVRKMLNWALDRSYIDASPVVKMTAPTEEKSRDRVLSADELRLVWLAAGRIGYPFGAMTQLLILTLQRRNEIAEAKWPEFAPEIDDPVWKLPAERAKNGQANDIPLSAAAVEIIRTLPKFIRPGKGLPKSRECPYLFTTTIETPVSGFARAKARLDAEIVKIQKEEAEKAGRDPTGVKPLPHWTFHDLRRSGTTRMAEDLGTSPHVVEAILNHVSGTIRGVARVYNRATFAKPKRQALDAWAAYISGLVSPSEGNVRRLRGAV